MRKRTKIIASIGPSSSSSSKLNKMIREGTDVFRINLSHSNILQAKKIVEQLKVESDKLNRPVATMIDLQGQKIRIKDFGKKTHVQLKNNDQFILDSSLPEGKGTNKVVGITYKELYKHLDKGDEILLSDALIKLEVIGIKQNKIITVVKRGGRLKPHQGLNKKGGGLTLRGITPKDKSDLQQALEIDIDYIAVSFVKDERDIKEIKKLIGKKQIGVIAKIERAEALLKIDEIADASDGILVARGDLGVEIGIEQLPAVQDRLIRKSIALIKLLLWQLR